VTSNDSPPDQLASFKLKLFWSAELTSSIALGVYMVAFNLLTVKTYGPFGISITTIGYAIPQTLLVLFGGFTSDNINKQTLYRICQILFILIGLTMFFACLKGLPPLWLLFLASTLSGMIAAFCSPAKTSLISDLVSESQVTSTQEFFYLATGLGWVLGSLLFSFLHIVEIPYIQNSTEVAAFLFYIFAMLPSIFLVPKGSNPLLVSKFKKPLLDEFRASLMGIKNSFLYLQSSSSLKILMWLLAIILILGMPFTILISIFAHDHPTLKPPEQFFSHIYTALSIGQVVGGFLGILIARPSLMRGTLFIYFIFGLCCSAVIALNTDQYWLILITVLLSSLFTTLCCNLLKGLIQSLSAENMRGRIAGLTQLMAGFSSASAGIAGFLVHYLSMDGAKDYSAYETVMQSMLMLLVVLALLTLPTMMKSRVRFQ
jgi:DHA3 family macrolide efflux protein-like MFS transporter